MSHYPTILIVLDGSKQALYLGPSSFLQWVRSPPNTGEKISQPNRALSPSLTSSGETTINQDLHGLLLQYPTCRIANCESTPSTEANLMQSSSFSPTASKSSVNYRPVLIAMIGVGSFIARLAISRDEWSLRSMGSLPVIRGMDTRKCNSVSRMALIATGTSQTRPPPQRMRVAGGSECYDGDMP